MGSLSFLRVQILQNNVSVGKINCALQFFQAFLLLNVL